MVKKTLNPLINIDTFHDDIDIKISNISNFNYINQINEILEFYENFKENQTFSKTTQRKLHGIYYTNFKIALNITKETIQHVKKNIYESYFLEPCVGLGIFVITYIDYVKTNFKLSRFEILQFLNKIYIADIDLEALDLSKKIIQKFIEVRLGVNFQIPEENIFRGNIIHDDSNVLRNFSSVFDKELLFDIIITNPPFKNLKATSKEFEEKELNLYKNYYVELTKNLRKELSSQQGTLNLYKIFVELIYQRFTTNDASIGMIIPSTILSDYTSMKLRKLIFKNAIVKQIFILNEESKEFKSVSQSMCFFGSKKINNPNNQISLINYSDNNTSKPITLSLNDFEYIDSNFSLINLNQIEFNILKKIHRYKKIKDISGILNLRGELDITLDKEYICEKKTEFNLIQGKNLNEWFFKKNNKFVNKNFLLKGNSQKIQLLSRTRLACHQISNELTNKRLKFSQIPPQNILGNSCNFISCDKEYNINGIQGILNSYLMDWRFRKFSSNNHINNYELDDLPINILLTNNEKILKYVSEIISGNLSKIVDLNLLVFHHYGLKKNEILEILNDYSDEYVNKMKKLISKNPVKVTNHNINKLSDLDLRMVKSIPEGGNWKNIPITIPSKRLEKIRKTGGRTTYYGRLRWDKPSYTIGTYITRPGNGTYIHPNDSLSSKPLHRLITPREAARLQSFTDSYQFFGSKSAIANQIGNAVPPIVSFVIATYLKNEFGLGNVISLFCGAGGLSEGFKKAGFKIIVANDFSAHAGTTYQFNHSKSEFILGDICLDETKKKIVNQIANNNIDFICGGPPCQGFSTAGKRLVDDPRNKLFKEFVDLVEKIKPKVFVFENVLGLLSTDKGKTFRSIISEFSNIGYNVSSQVLHACNFGVPQRRKRVIIVGSLEKNFHLDINPLIEDESNFVTVRDAISNLVNINPTNTENEIYEFLETHSNYQKYLNETISLEDYLNSISKIEAFNSRTLFSKFSAISN